ncbi:MAG: Scramblase, partial [Podila humilis]
VGTPVVVPEDPFGVLQPYDTAAKVLSQPALIMTRQIEMMNVLVGFEQANKYAIVDPTGSPIGYIAEEDTTFVKAMSRQMLRTHRPFKASVLDLEGNEILKIHRPFAFINSRIMISTPDDRLIGEVQQEWHLVRRRYNLFTGDAASLNRVQFAHIDGGFLALDFDMQDEQGQKMASVNRNFVGFARELFTDSGQYALRFDAALVDRGGLTLDQRAIMLACAVSIDFDYFSRHSGNG